MKKELLLLRTTLPADSGLPLLKYVEWGGADLIITGETIACEGKLIIKMEHSAFLHP